MGLQRVFTTSLLNTLSVYSYTVYLINTPGLWIYAPTCPCKAGSARERKGSLTGFRFSKPREARGSWGKAEETRGAGPRACVRLLRTSGSGRPERGEGPRASLSGRHGCSAGPAASGKKADGSAGLERAARKESLRGAERTAPHSLRENLRRRSAFVTLR